MQYIRNMQLGMKACKYAITIFMVCCALACSKPINSIESQTENQDLNTNSRCPHGVKATIRNFTGLDGCSWLLVLEDGKKLEPTNLENFDFIKLEDGKKVIVEYEAQTAMASICMAGSIVKITCISEE